jgi:hypothetical protein
MKKNKKKNYSLRSKVYKVAGLATIGLSSLTSFLIYQSLIDWSNFKKEIDEFIVVQEETLKLNMTIAFPVTIGLIIFLFIAKKKNKVFLEDKVSANLLFIIVILYLFYSIVEVTLVVLVGAFFGSVADEFGFSLASKRNAEKAIKQQEEDKEYSREKRRIKARLEARETNGSV